MVLYSNYRDILKNKTNSWVLSSNELINIEFLLWIWFKNKTFNWTKTYLSDALNKWKYNFKSKYRQTYNNLLPIFTNTCSVNTWEKYKVFSWKCVKFDTWVFLLYFLHKIVVQWLACQIWCIFRTKWFIYFLCK